MGARPRAWPLTSLDRPRAITPCTGGTCLAFLLDAVVTTAQITSADWILDLGCGRARHAQWPSRPADSQHAGNVLPVLACDGNLPAISQLFGAGFGGHRRQRTALDGYRPRLRPGPATARPGGALVIISQGPPMWFADTSWASDLRAYLAQWVGSPLTGTCGTDREAVDERRARMEAHVSTVDLVEHSHENQIDLTYIAGHLLFGEATDNGARRAAAGVPVGSAARARRAPC